MRRFERVVAVATGSFWLDVLRAIPPSLWMAEHGATRLVVDLILELMLVSQADRALRRRSPADPVDELTRPACNSASTLAAVTAQRSAVPATTSATASSAVSNTRMIGALTSPRACRVSLVRAT